MTFEDSGVWRPLRSTNFDLEYICSTFKFVYNNLTLDSKKMTGVTVAAARKQIINKFYYKMAKTIGRYCMYLNPQHHACEAIT